jgi:hypothetical protein
MRQTHNGIVFDSGRAYDTDYVVHIIDPKLVRMKIVLGFDNVPNSVSRNHAQLGFNSVGWGRHRLGRGVPNDLLYISGLPVQTNPIDYRRYYSVNIDKNGDIHFDERLKNPYNVIGFDRIIGRNGVYEKRIDNSGLAPRTIYAKTEDGKLLIFACEGRGKTQRGLRFSEVWELLTTKYAVTDAGNADGGGSTCAVNTYFGSKSLIKYYDYELRPVVSQTLFYADPIGTQPDEPVSIGERLIQHAERLSDAPLSADVIELQRNHPDLFK